MLKKFMLIYLLRFSQRNYFHVLNLVIVKIFIKFVKILFNLLEVILDLI
jgi:hypothetical protein